MAVGASASQATKQPSIDGVAPADERTRLLPTVSSGGSIADGATVPVDDCARRILLSTTISRLGSRSWEFAAPLLLLEWIPGSLAAPAALGLACAFFRTTVSPRLGTRADQWDRMQTVVFGLAMQAVGCLASVGALVVWNSLSSGVGDDDDALEKTRFLTLVLVIASGVVETLGAQLASVAVKKEWVPIVFAEDVGTGDGSDDAGDAPTEEGRAIFSCLNLPLTDMGFVNTAMTNIDLISAMFGPVLTGWILQIMGGGEVGDAFSTQSGFAVIALFNAISFLPEMILLRGVYRSCPALQIRRAREQKGANKGSESEAGEGSELNEDRTKGGKNAGHGFGERKSPWAIWIHHPSGLPLLTISLASLYLTALSPAGVVLTAYLVTIGLSPTSIGVFRAFGALSGVVGICLFSLVRKGKSGVAASGAEQGAAERSASAGTIERLRRVSLAFLLLEVVSILTAAAAYVPTGASSAPEGDAFPWRTVVFLSAVVVSRAGLYSFDVGGLEIEQHIVDERHRNAVGSVEGALCSLAEMGMYVLSIALPDPAQFGWQVGVSAAAVSFGGVCFGLFLYVYKMHPHHHHHEGGCEGCSLGRHGHHHKHHTHTWQQERDLEEYGYHVHLHRHF